MPGSSDITIRNFRIDDYDALTQLWDAAGLPYKPRGRDSREKITKEILQPTAIFLVAEVGRKLVGSIFGTHDGRKGWINRVAVAPDYRNRGIARKLVKAVEDRFDKLGIEIVACLIEDWNTTSMKVFEQLGYTRHTDVFYFTKRKRPDV